MPKMTSNRWIGGMLLVLVGAFAPACIDEQVTVTTEPQGAKVFWDSVYVGDSPLTFAPPLNRQAVFEEVHIIEVVKEGYMTGLGYVAERGGGADLMTNRVEIVMHEAPDWYVSAEPTALDAPPVEPAEEAPAPAPPAAVAASPSATPEKTRNELAAERAGITIEEAIETSGRIACDIRVVRVSDGRVLATVYGLSDPDRMLGLAEQLATQLAKSLPANVQGRAVMIRLRNRRRSAAGEQLAGEMTDILFRELVYTGRLKLYQKLDIRSLVEPRMLDHSQVVTNPDVNKQLAEVDYLIQGGLAESRDPRRPGVILDYNREDEEDQ